MPVLNRLGARVYVVVTLGILFIVVLGVILTFQEAPNLVYQLELGEEETYEIKYHIKGTKVQSIEAYPESFSMVIDIEEAPEQGSLKVQFGRSDMALLLGYDPLAVRAFVDEKVASSKIGLAKDTVTMTVDFARGSEVIELIGAKND